VEYVNDISGLVSQCAPFAGSGAASVPVYACKIMRFFYQGVSENSHQKYSGQVSRPNIHASPRCPGGCSVRPFTPWPGACSLSLTSAGYPVHHHLERRLEAGLANIHTDDGLFLTMPDTCLALCAPATCPTYDGQRYLFTDTHVLRAAVCKVSTCFSKSMATAQAMAIHKPAAT